MIKGFLVLVLSKNTLYDGSNAEVELLGLLGEIIEFNLIQVCLLELLGYELKFWVYFFKSFMEF